MIGGKSPVNGLAAISFEDRTHIYRVDADSAWADPIRFRHHNDEMKKILKIELESIPS
jgi:hypothetical protein